MMKKILIVLAVLLLAAGVCFAQDANDSSDDGKKEFDLEISVGVPIHWSNRDLADSAAAAKRVTADTAIGAALLFNFSQKFGLTLDTDFFFGGDIGAKAVATNGSSYAELFGANVLLGPVIYLYNGNFLRIPLAFGVHLYYFSEELFNTSLDNWSKTRDLQLGPGGYIGVQFHFNNNIYIFSRTTVAVDLFRWQQTKGANGGIEYSTSNLGLSFGWEVKPALGLGIKF
jgi:hypothetical protein